MYSRAMRRSAERAARANGRHDGAKRDPAALHSASRIFAWSRPPHAVTGVQRACATLLQAQALTEVPRRLRA